MSNTTWKALFGSTDNCECSDCSSIFSPRAYLLDILQYLDSRIASGSITVLGKLFERRPDIGNLLLTCANTNTEIPYIDLVNEIMEYYIINLNGMIPMPVRDTGKATAKELRAEPQYTLIDAYDIIYKKAVYPLNLPYHQPLDVIRAYLRFLKTSRAELMYVFNNGSIPTLALDAENLELSLKEFEILTNVDFKGTAIPATSAEVFYGNPVPAYTGTGISARDFIKRTGLTFVELVEALRTKFINPGQEPLNVLQSLITGSLFDALTLYQSVSNANSSGTIPPGNLENLLLSKSIAPPDFLLWINSHFSDFQNTITLYQTELGCDIDKTILHSIQWIYETPTAAADPAISDGWLNKFHQFIRLWRKTKWTIQELDAMIFALGKNKTDKDLIHALSVVMKINEMLEVPVLRLASIWGDMDSYGENSLYAKLFLKQSGNADSATLVANNPFALSPLNEISVSTDKLIDNIPAICAALSISAEEYLAIINDAGLNASTATISIGNISAIYRYKFLADSLELSINDFCLLKSTCFKINPFTNVDKTLELILNVKKVQDSGFSAGQLDHILNGNPSGGNNFALSKATMLQVLPGLWQNLRKIDDANSSASPPLNPSVILQLKQSEVVGSISSLTGLDVLTTRAIISTPSIPIVAAMAKYGLTGAYFTDPAFSALASTSTDTIINSSKLTIAPLTNSVRWKGFISPAADGEYTFTLKVHDNTQAAKLIIEGKTLIDIATSAAPVSPVTLSGKATLTGGKMVPIQIDYVAAANHDIELRWSSATQHLTHLGGQFIYPEEQINNTILDFIDRAYRAYLTISLFDLNADEVNYLVSHTNFAILDFLKMTSDSWIRIHDYTSLRKRATSTALLEIFQGAENELQVSATALPSEKLISKIASALKCNKEYLSYLSGNANPPPAFIPIASFYQLTAGSFVNEIALLEILRALDLAKRTNMAITDVGLPAWVTWESDLTLPGDFRNLFKTAEQIKHAVKSKYNDTWLTIARQVNDPIRENQERALISYLLTLGLKLNGDLLTDADGLFEYLLIDVQMTSITVTSRLIQATLAAQLFADRCLLGIENGISINAIDADEWDWMKHYSVAAGLKKLFIYVENYLDPSLRDDKSPFFKELESQLKKLDITDANMEDIFRGYLYKLKEVSNMEVCGMHKDLKSQRLYVFARTHAAPYSYYFRIQDENEYWSPWENVPLDIVTVESGGRSGVHLVPIVWKNRLFLFWPEFSLKTVKSAQTQAVFNDIAKTTPDNSAPQTYWEVKLAWSEYAKDKWTPKKVSKEFITPLLGSGLGVNYSYLAPSQPYQFNFRPQIDSNNALNITAGIQYMDLAVYPVGTFKLTDVHEKISLPAGSFADIINFVYNTTWNPLPNPYKEQYKILYESYEKSDVLVIQDMDVLDVAIDHRITFQDTGAIQTFNNKRLYPFFYTDVTGNRTYFVEPKLERIKGFKDIADPIRMTMNFPLNKAAIATKHYFDEEAPRLVESIDTFRLFRNIDLDDLDDDKANLFAPFNGITSIYRPHEDLFSFYTFYHPFTSAFIEKLNVGGVSQLLKSDTTEFFDAVGLIDDSPPLLANDNGKTFDTYNPDFHYIKKYDPGDPERNYYLQNVDFSKYGTYSLYNWELFFHAPLLIATRLSSNGKYADARKWFHYIFDPTSADDDKGVVNSPFWGLLPFKRGVEDAIQKMLTDLQNNTGSQADFDKAVNEWRANPFNAFAIARNRTVAFMKNVVMRYLDNLIAWADDLFTTYIRENINEATQLYVLALHILGEKPQYVPSRGDTQPQSYNSLKAVGLDTFGDALVPYQNAFPNSGSVGLADNSIPQSLLGIGKALYFCIPANDKLLHYWTRIGDRLFKIRHGQNINGIVKPLALYEPPIDPALLLKAHAAGLDIGSILADLESPAPIYRFNYLLQKAKEFCGEVVSLGNALLSATEKEDAESLSRLRQTQEIDMLKMVTEIKKRQVIEAQANIDTLTSSRLSAMQRLQHYANELLGNGATDIPATPDIPDELRDSSSLPKETLINPVTSSIDVSLIQTEESGVKIIPKELQEIAFAKSAEITSFAANAAETLAGIFHLLPDFYIMTSPIGVGAQSKVTGGQQIGNAIGAGARALSGQANLFSAEASHASRMASYIRREQDWVFQANMAIREIVQLDRQIIAGQVRLQMAEHEFENHEQQMANANEVDQFLKTKFSNEELYQWMADKLQEVHKQGYQLAYEMARKAEKAYRFELGLQESNFVQYGYFQDSFLGITAGDQLQLALKQLDSSFMDLNLREFELTKHISLQMLDPASLLQLIETGMCNFTIPEEWFDMDYPGHYFRRIKSVSLSIPCVAGPYTTINCTLRLISNSIRIDNDVTGGYGNASHFFSNNTPFTAIATSQGQNDSGTFELNFHDERYLPYEGAGAISTWTLELNGKYNNGTIDLSQFDYSTISDIILHLRFTSREDTTLRNPSITNLQTYQKASNFRRLINVKQEMANEFYQFINAPLPTGDQVLKLALDQNRFPYFASRDTITIDSIEIFADAENLTGLDFTIKPAPTVPLTTLAQVGFGDAWHAKADFAAGIKVNATTIGLVELTRSTGTTLTKNDFAELFVLLHFKMS